ACLAAGGVSIQSASRLGVNSAQLDGVGNAADGEHVGRDPVVDAVRFREANHSFEGFAQDELQLFVDGRFLPEVSLAILDPFKVGGSDAARVGKDVRDDEDFLVGQDFIGGGGGGAVGTFTDDFGFDSGRILAGDDVFRGCGYQNFTIGEKQVSGISGLCPGETH